MRSVMPKVFERAMSEKNALGPKKVSYPALPIWPQAGKANRPEVGRAKVQESTPALAAVKL